MKLRELLVLAVIVVGLLLLGRYTVYLYREELRDWKRVEVEFTDVGGLRAKDKVLIQGSRMGRVREIKLFKDRQLVILDVLPEVQVYKIGSGARIVSANSLGYVDVVLDLGLPTSGPLPPGERLLGTMYVGVGQGAPDVSSQKALREGLSDFAAMTSAIQDPRSGTTGQLLFDPHRKIATRVALRDLAATWRDTERSLADIENGQGVGRGLDPDGLLALANTISGIRATFVGLGQGLRGAARGEGNIGRFVADPAQGPETQAALSSWADALRGVHAGEGLAGRLSDPRSNASESLEGTVDALADGTSEARAGRGLLGALGSPEVDEAAHDLARSVPRALGELSRNPAVSGRGAYFELHDALGSFDDSVVRLRRGLTSLRRDLGARSTFQGAIFAIF